MAFGLAGPDIYPHARRSDPDRHSGLGCDRVQREVRRPPRQRTGVTKALPQPPAAFLDLTINTQA